MWNSIFGAWRSQQFPSITKVRKKRSYTRIIARPISICAVARIKLKKHTTVAFLGKVCPTDKQGCRAHFIRCAPQRIHSTPVGWIDCGQGSGGVSSAKGCQRRSLPRRQRGLSSVPEVKPASGARQKKEDYRPHTSDAFMDDSGKLVFIALSLRLTSIAVVAWMTSSRWLAKHLVRDARTLDLNAGGGKGDLSTKTWSVEVSRIQRFGNMVEKKWKTQKMIKQKQKKHLNKKKNVQKTDKNIPQKKSYTNERFNILEKKTETEKKSKKRETKWKNIPSPPFVWCCVPLFPLSCGAGCSTWVLLPSPPFCWCGAAVPTRLCQIKTNFDWTNVR